MIYRIGKELIFPQPVDVEPDGLLCVGGDLSVDRLLLAYSHGIFPWFSFRDYDELINKGKYDVSIGDDFDGVIRGCQKADGRYDSEGAWLSEDIINAYTELHRQNLAQSVEVWEGDRLVGGLYGVTLGRCFIGAANIGDYGISFPLRAADFHFLPLLRLYISCIKIIETTKNKSNKYADKQDNSALAARSVGDTADDGGEETEGEGGHVATERDYDCG